MEMRISVPTSVGEYVASRVASGGYGDASAYFCELVTREQRRRAAAEEFARILDETMATGISGHRIPELASAVEADMRTVGQVRPE